MRTLFATLAATLLAAGCVSNSISNTPTPGPAGNKAFKYGRGDGKTMATAVQIRTRSETEGGVLIREWIRANYPGFTIQYQELLEERDHAYNMITLIGANDAIERVYFDISSFYRRIGSDKFPKPLS